jgi:hypothetical protein
MAENDMDQEDMELQLALQLSLQGEVCVCTCTLQRVQRKSAQRTTSCVMSIRHLHSLHACLDWTNNRMEMALRLRA